MSTFFLWFKNRRDMGVLFLRLFIGVRLIYGVIDNIFSWKKMLEFAAFLENFHFPFPIASAIISVFFQCIAGIMIIVGLKIRLAALLMIGNFLIALLMVHLYDSFEGMTPALAILFASILFLFQGAGKYALDSYEN